MVVVLAGAHAVTGPMLADFKAWVEAKQAKAYQGIADGDWSDLRSFYKQASEAEKIILEIERFTDELEKALP